MPVEIDRRVCAHVFRLQHTRVIVDTRRKDVARVSADAIDHWDKVHDGTMVTQEGVAKQKKSLGRIIYSRWHSFSSLTFKVQRCVLPVHAALGLFSIFP